MHTDILLSCPCGAKTCVVQSGESRWFAHCAICGRLMFWYNPQTNERLRAGGKLCPHDPELKACKDGRSQTSWCPDCRIRVFMPIPDKDNQRREEGTTAATGLPQQAIETELEEEKGMTQKITKENAMEVRTSMWTHCCTTYRLWEKNKRAAARTLAPMVSRICGTAVDSSTISRWLKRFNEGMVPTAINNFRMRAPQAETTPGQQPALSRSGCSSRLRCPEWGKEVKGFVLDRLQNNPHADCHEIKLALKNELGVEVPLGTLSSWKSTHKAERIRAGTLPPAPIPLGRNPDPKRSEEPRPGKPFSAPASEDLARSAVNLINRLQGENSSLRQKVVELENLLEEKTRPATDPAEEELKTMLANAEAVETKES